MLAMPRSNLHIGYRMMTILVAWVMFLTSFAMKATDKINIRGVGAGDFTGYTAFRRSVLYLTHPMAWNLFIQKPQLIVVFVIFLAMLVMAFAPVFDARTDGKWKILGPVFIVIGVLNYVLLAQYLLGEVYEGFHLWSASFMLMGVAFLIPEDRGISIPLGGGAQEDEKKKR
jgi:hypothetical protein